MPKIPLIFAVRDSKCDYPAACNSMETLLIHKAHRESNLFDKMCEMLRLQGVSTNKYEYVNRYSMLLTLAFGSLKLN